MSVNVQWCAKYGDGEMCQKRGIVIQLNPADHAMILQILRNLRLADFQMLGELALQAARIREAASARAGALAAARTSCEVADANAQGLACLYVVRGDLVGIREQEDSRSGRSFIRFI